MSQKHSLKQRPQSVPWALIPDIQLNEIWTECLPQFGLCSGAPKHGEVAPVLGRLGTRSKRLRNALQSILKEGVSKRRLAQVTCWSQRLRDEMQALVSRRAGEKNVTGDGVQDQLHTSGLEPETFDRVLLAVHLLASEPNFEQGSVVETVSDLELLHGCATQARKRLGKGKQGRDSEEALNFLIWRLADFYAGHYGRPTAHWAKEEGRKSPFVRLVHGVHKLLPPKARAKSDKALGERIDEVLKLWGRPRPQDKKFEFLA